MRFKTRVLCKIFGPAIAVAALAVVLVSAPAGSQQPASIKTVRLTEGTNIAATLSPDHQQVIIDLQGALWSLPIAGGSATRLTDPFLEPARPDWSPRGDLVAFESYAGGTFHIWMMKPDGSDLRQLTTGHGDDRDPRFSPDGATIAFSSDRAFKGSYDVWTVDVAAGTLTQRTFDNNLEEFEPAWSPDGTKIAFVSGTSSAGARIESVDMAGNRTTLIAPPTGARVNSPSWSPDGSKLTYIQFQNNKSQLMIAGSAIAPNVDVFPFPVSWLSASMALYTADGKIWTVNVSGGAPTQIAFQADVVLNRPSYTRKTFDFDTPRRQAVKGIVGPALSPDGKRVVFQAVNQLWLMDIGGTPRQLTNDSYYKCDPSWSPDGAKIAYSSDKAGTEDIYVLDVASGAEQRVTSLPGAEVSSAWSRDGTKIAFQDQTGATFTVELATGTVRQVIGALFAPGKPTWSANGNTIAVGALKAYTRRYREGTSQILTVDVATGALTYFEPAPFKSLSTRGEDGPVYSPDGTAMVFVVEGVLWTQPVDAQGHPSGVATQITSEPSAAPTWSGDSQQVLYVSNGNLRLVARRGGAAQTIVVDLGWQQEKTTGRYIVWAGRFWDGLGPDVRTNVDIEIVGNRIASISPHRVNPGQGQGNPHVVDASQFTVMPGLWESHTHEWISGKFFGDRLGRLWLAYGVTSLQSVGDPAYRAVETREAFGSGQRVGPRYFATGEAIDGERVFYNFMRPLTGGDEQLARELSLAKALDYDMVKTYVRLPHADQAKVIDFAHNQMGVWLGSHYMLPGMAFGMDVMTHVSATTRLGFAYTRSSGGISYRDMTDLFIQSGMTDISTTFNSSLYAEDPTMVDDPRLLVLNPPWEEAGLRAKRDAAVNTDQTVSLDSLQKEENTVRTIVRGGGKVLAGTDSPLDNPATALHLNLRAQVKFGLLPWEALQTATLFPARAYGVDKDLGSLEPGKLADLIVVSGNPLQNIRDVANIQGTIRNGRLFSSADLMAPFASPQAKAATKVQAATDVIPLSPQRQAEHDKYWWHDPEEWDDGCMQPH
jgi:Tol biopolymer transport system component